VVLCGVDGCQAFVQNDLLFNFFNAMNYLFLSIDYFHILTASHTFSTLLLMPRISKDATELVLSFYNLNFGLSQPRKRQPPIPHANTLPLNLGCQFSFFSVAI